MRHIEWEMDRHDRIENGEDPDPFDDVPNGVQPGMQERERQIEELIARTASSAEVIEADRREGRLIGRTPNAGEKRENLSIAQLMTKGFSGSTPPGRGRDRGASSQQLEAMARQWEAEGL